MGVRVGTSQLYGFNTFEKPITYGVDYIKIHEKYYNRTDRKYDIGLVHVSQPIEFSERVNKVALQTETFDEDGYFAISTGWGYTEVKPLHFEQDY